MFYERWRMVWSEFVVEKKMQDKMKRIQIVLYTECFKSM